MQDTIENYLRIDILKDGRVKILLKNDNHREGNIYKKLAMMGYIREGQNKFRFIDSLNMDEFLTKHQLIEVFVKYLETLDISKYEGRLTFEDISNHCHYRKAINDNGLMQEYMNKNSKDYVR